MSFLSNTDSELEKLQSPIEKEDQDINDDPDSKNEINKDEVSNFKIFGNDTTELPEKEQMDRNLDELILGRDKNQSFFLKFFKKKDRISEAKKFFAKKDKKEDDERKKAKNPNSRLRRLLIYLLFILVVLLSIFLTPYRASLAMAFPSLSIYFDIITPLYNDIMSYLIL